MVKGQEMNWPKDHIRILELSFGLPPFGRVPSFGMWIADWGRHRAWGNNFEFVLRTPTLRAGSRFRIANCEFKNKKAGVRIQNEKSKSKYLFSTGYRLLNSLFLFLTPDTRNPKRCLAIVFQQWPFSHRVSVLRAIRAIR